MQKTAKISEAEWEIMKIVWEQPVCSAKEIADQLAEKKQWNHRTVKTLLSRLVKKGVVAYRTDGNRYLYEPLIAREAVVREESRSFLERVFDGGALPMLTHFVKSTKMTLKEIEVLKKLLDEIAERKTEQPEYRGFHVNDLPKVEKITFDEDVITVCREFRGPFENSQQNTMQVTEYADKAGIAYEPYFAIGVYWGDPANDKPEELRSYHGVKVKSAPKVEPPHFVYTMKKGTEYLHTQVKGDPAKTIPAGYVALFNYMGLNNIRAGASGGHQLMRMEDGEMIIDIYLEIEK